MHRLSTLRELSAAQWRLLLAALGLLPLIGLGLRVVGLRRVQVALARTRPGSAVDRALDAPQVDAIARLVAAAARHGPYKARCLSRSLALQWLLRRRGMETDLRVGVRKVAGRLEAHAWLERDDVPLVDLADVRERYAAFERITSPASTAWK